MNMKKIMMLKFIIKYIIPTLYTIGRFVGKTQARRQLTKKN